MSSWFLCFSYLDLKKDHVAILWASGSCVSVPVGGIGKDPGIWEVGGVRGISRMGWGSRVVAIMVGLVEALVHFFFVRRAERREFVFVYVRIFPQ
jgi:hypothetical protein